ncbi:endonuclease VII domain-containing protein [Streptomyces sp900105755]|uniref:endonuclease VII domain-containing protein n=1 Tax=Streptomyces sp. 900105755 TaxID=3154389 RepID=UPI0033183EDC
MTQKRCTKCELSKPLEAFPERKASKDGRNSWCRECYRTWHRARYQPKTRADDSPRNCVNCGTTYRPASRRPSVYCSRSCKDEYRKSSRSWRETYLQRKYGISADDYDRLLAEQGGGCALCGVKPEDLTTGKYRTYLHVDHCHESGRVRGLLCPDHNLLLGRFGDSPEMFRRVLSYLEAAASD